MFALFLLLLGLQEAWSAQDVLGCGGFIKASKSIDFSKINVQLLTRQGSLKYETECAPNNGYFFIPVYEKGEYILKVSPPLGWKFTPEEFPVNVDGETDSCSQNKDINFVFAGFGVVGQVLAAGDINGPAGVSIELLSKDETEVVQKTVTVKDGRYVFTAVAGADHKVRAHHPVWEFTKSVGAVVITGDNGRAEDLIVAGFDVSGQVVSGNLPIAGVNIVLFGSGGGVKCADNSPSQAQGPPGASQLCQTTSNDKGEFIFPVVPRGEYVLVPFYRGEHTQFEVGPRHQEIVVGLDSYRLDRPFVVEGFSVKGRVLTGPGGPALPNTLVRLEAARVYEARTDAEGQYFIEKIETGIYAITATADGVEFAALKAEISPQKPVLPVMVAHKFLVSGHLDFSTVAADPARKLKLVSPGKPEFAVHIGKDGKFSAMLVPAPYTVSVVPSASDNQMGIVFAPRAIDVIVKSEPIANLYFSPVRVTIGGRVRCVDQCPSLTVVLRTEGTAAEEATDAVVDGRFSFQNQLPGRYKISIEEAGLCWDKPSIAFSIESESRENLELTQAGWIMEVHSSHHTSLKYRSQDGQITGSLNIPVGSSSHCMASKSEITLQTSGCHQFEGENKGFKWSPGQERLNLRAEKHLVSGRVSSIETIPDLQLMVTSPSEVKTIALTQPENKGGVQSYRFSYMSNPHEEITMEPLAAKFLFNPVKLHISVEDDCQVDSAIFTASKGLFISGSISPALEGASVVLSSPSLHQPVLASTDVKGQFSLGPFSRDLEYTVTAEKVGYIISNTDTVGQFTAKKLASIVVHLVEETGARVAEAVVSLSGGEQNFRTNQQTGTNGTLSFLGLSPGEYFIKPLLKEYEFSPKSKLITVKEGTEEVVEITATRIANSLFGSLTGLKGDPEPGVVLEVVGEGEGCRGHQEEGTTGSDGKFRIRGLARSCEYRLGLKHSSTNAHVERTIPATQYVKADSEDILGIEMMAVRPRTTMDVSLLVKTKKENTKNVKAKLYCSGNINTPLHTVKLDTVKFVIFPSILADGKSCWIHVEANSIHLNQRVKPQRVDFRADKPFQHFTLELDMESNLARGEMGQASWMTLPLIILLVTAVLHWDKVSPHMTSLAEKLERRLMNRKPARGRGNSPARPEEELSKEDIDKTVRFVEASTRKKIKPKKI